MSIVKQFEMLSPLQNQNPPTPTRDKTKPNTTINATAKMRNKCGEACGGRPRGNKRVDGSKLKCRKMQSENNCRRKSKQLFLSCFTLLCPENKFPVKLNQFLFPLCPEHIDLSFVYFTRAYLLHACFPGYLDNFLDLWSCVSGISLHLMSYYLTFSERSPRQLSNAT